MVVTPRGGAAKESLTRTKTTLLLELHQIQLFATIGPRKNSKIFPKCVKTLKLLLTSLAKMMTAFSSWLNKVTLTGQRESRAILLTQTFRFHFHSQALSCSVKSHANHMDDLLGAMFDIDDVVQEIKDWIAANGGYEKNALYVTADHDHYLTVSSPLQCRLDHEYTLHSH